MENQSVAVTNVKMKVCGPQANTKAEAEVYVYMGLRASAELCRIAHWWAAHKFCKLFGGVENWDGGVALEDLRSCSWFCGHLEGIVRGWFLLGMNVYLIDAL